MRLAYQKTVLEYVMKEATNRLRFIYCELADIAILIVNEYKGIMYRLSHSMGTRLTTQEPVNGLDVIT